MSLNSKKSPFDRIVISSDTNPMFLSLWPYIFRGWQKLYGIPPLLALLGSRTTPCPFKDNVIFFEEAKDLPRPNQAKMLRYFVASTFDPEEVVVINDVDLLPINRGYIDNLFAQRRPGTVMGVGGELYHGPEKGKFPAGYTAAEAGVFRELINPKGLRWHDLLRSWQGLRVFDHKEDIGRDVHHEHPDTFSDESLIRALAHNHQVSVTHVERGFDPYTTRAICRSDWKFDPAKIDDGTIVEAHLLRPYTPHKLALDQLFEHVGVS